MHLLTLRALANALNERCRGRLVRKAGMLDSERLGLRIAAEQGTDLLTFSVRPGSPHARLDGALERLPRWNRALTDHLGGADDALAGCTIEAIVPLGWERIMAVRLALHPRAADVDPRPRWLFLELLPRTPYLVVCAGAPPTLLAAIRSPGTTRPDRRSMERGTAYELPFGADLEPLLADPQQAAVDAVRDAWTEGGVANVLRGVLAAEVAGIVQDATTPETSARRLVEFTGPLALQQREGAPRVTIVPAPDPARAGARAIDATLEVMRRWSDGLEEGHQAQRAGQAVAGYAKRQRRRLSRARGAIERELARTTEAGGIRRRAEILLASLHLVQPGQERARLDDPYGGDPVEIELDPRAKPQATAEAMFREARRLERAGAHLEERMKKLRDAETSLREIESALARNVRGDIIDLARRLVDSGELDRSALGPAAGTPEPPPRLPYRVIQLTGDWEIWVGRSSADNDLLTHKLAAPHDIWLHAFGTSGAHVILRRPPGYKGTPPAAILREAAAYAAQFSEARHSREVPVTYTEQRYVRKPRGSPPGTAVCLRDQTMMVEPRDRREI